MEWQCNNKEIQPFPVRAYLNYLHNINTMFLLVTAQYTIQKIFDPLICFEFCSCFLFKSLIM